ncbi:MAG: hypothetical protein SF187_05180 [Deltaproteobacteria bacterium]|nr:hypothetical protein [Deltaproteobacteria bacterium]
MRWALVVTMLVCAACDARHVLGRATREAPCGSFVAGPDLAVCSAGFVGAEAPAVAVGADGALVLAMQDLAGVSGGTSHLIAVGKAGFVRVLPRTRQVLSRTILGDVVFDLEVSTQQGFIAVLGAPWGVALFEADGAKPLFTAPIQASRISVGDDGTVAVWDNASAAITVFDRTGKRLGSFSSRAVAGEGDVAVDSANRLVVVAGQSDGRPVCDAIDYQGNPRWKNYDWPAGLAESEELRAVSKGVRIHVGRDGALYLLGESNGGNTVFSRDPRVFAEPAPSVSYDEFNTPYNTSKAITFVGRFAPRTGELMLGQLLLARAEGPAPRKGVATMASDIAADEQGQVMVAVAHPCCGPAFKERKVAGRTLIASSSDFAVVILGQDFRIRALWTTFGTGGASVAAGVAFGAGVAAVTGLQGAVESGMGPLVTQQPLFPSIAANGGYVAFWPAP